MSIKTNYFDNIDYYASDFVKSFRATNSNGVVNKNDFFVNPNSPANLNIVVDAGEAFIEGYFIKMDVAETLPLTANTSGLNRKDLVILKLDLNNSISHLEVVQGTPASSPVVPTVSTVDGEYYIKLAEVTINNNVSSVVETDIKNVAIGSNSKFMGDVLDFNNCTNQGNYSVSTDTSIPNAPFVGSMYGTLVVVNRFDNDIDERTYNYCNQVVILNNGRIFTRTYQNSWSNWHEMVYMINGEVMADKLSSVGMDTDLILLTGRNNRGVKIDRFAGHVEPTTDGVAYDNSANLGSASSRWKQLYAGTTTISTSDRNYKQQIQSIEDIVLDAWSEVNYCKFKFNDAVEEKGEYARFHIGLIAQDIEEAFTRNSLDAFEYGLLCKDLKEDGTYIYSIRPDECQFLEMALMRREISRLKA